jgi:hypothetical protein
MRNLICIMIVLTAAAASMPSMAASRRGTARTWPEEKCARYGEAWSEALRRVGAKGLSLAFLDAHMAFLASGCTAGDVCPRSSEELDLANIMVIRAMNAGTASTFPPFRCR